MRLGPAYASHGSLQDEQQEEDGIHSKYAIQEELGKGAFAVVKRAVERETGELFAVKVIPRKRVLAGLAVRREVEILTKLDHANVVRLQECFDNNPSTIYVVMEYVGGGDLMDYVTAHGPLDEPLARAIMRQVLQALAYVHALGISHRDIKPDNILLVGSGLQTPESVHIKVTDFGLAKIADSGSVLRTFCGTMSYLAPEVIKTRDATRGGAKRASAFYSNAVDMWSVGCLVYVLLTGYCPFSGATQEQLCRQIVTGNYSTEPLDMCRVSAKARAFITELLVVDASKRPSAKGALMLDWLLHEKDTNSSNSDAEDHIRQEIENSREDIDDVNQDSVSEVDSTEIRAATAKLSLDAQTSLINKSQSQDYNNHYGIVRDFEHDSQIPNDAAEDSEDSDDAVMIPPNAWLMLRTMPDSKPFKDQVLMNDVVWFGRANRCDVDLEDGRISKIHCAIRRNLLSTSDSRKYTFHLCDFSLNGCFVNGVKIGKGMQAELMHGDVVEMFRDSEKLSFKLLLRQPDEYRIATRPHGRIEIRHTDGKENIGMRGRSSSRKGGSSKRQGEEMQSKSKKMLI